MYLETELIPLTNDRYVLAIGVHEIGQGAPERVVPGEVRVIARSLGSDEGVDLTAACTLPRPADEAEARMLQQMARGQAKQAKSENSRPMREMCERNYEQFSRQAESAASDSVWPPAKIAACGEDRLLVGIFAGESRNARFSAALRVVNTRTGEIEFEETDHAEGYATQPRSLVEFSAASRDGRTLFHQVRERKLLGLGGRQSVHIIERELAPGGATRTMKQIPWQAMTELESTSTHWLVLIRNEARTQVRLVEHGTGRSSTSFMVRGDISSHALALESGLLALVQSGGVVTILDLETGEQSALHPFMGLRRDSWSLLAISPNGEWLAVVVDEKMKLIRLADGHQTSLPDLPLVTEPDEPDETRIGNAIAFVGETLLICRGGIIEEINSPDLDYVAPARAEPIDFGPVDPTWGLEELLDHAGLSHKIDAIRPYYQPAVLLPTKALGKKGWKDPEEGGPPLGTSRLGGWPDLPLQTDWPMWEDRPMAFLAQINLPEMHAANPEVRLPDSGLLSFFLGCTNQTYAPDEDPSERYFINLMAGSDPDKPDGWRILFFPDTNALRRTRYDREPLPMLHDPAACEPRHFRKVLPDEQSVAYEQLELTDEERERYNLLLVRTGGDADVGSDHDNQLMGYPMLLQGGPAELFCETAQRGENPFRLHDDPAIKADAASWCLLLQLVSDPNAEFLWGDGGHFYYYVRREKAERGDFSESWVYFEN